MEVKSAKFLVSNTDVTKCPAPDKPEYGFIGRSNVGKSSLINMLTGRTSLAKTSVKPGKTQLINHFIINDSWYLVDLPGYGFAKVSQTLREGFEKLITSYILNRENMMCLFVLVDSRHEMQQIDKEFMEWLAENEIPFVIVFTKTDKLSKVNLKKSLDAYKAELSNRWEELPKLFYTSAEKLIGKEEILSFIEETNKLFKRP